MIEALLSLTFIAHVIRVAVPYVLAGICGSLTERAGVIDLALEAKLLFGAFAAAAVAHATGSIYAGIAGAMLAGMLVAAIQLGCALWLEADQVIVGIALNLIALGGTRFVMELLYGQSANTPASPVFPSGLGADPIIWIAGLAIVLVPLAVRRTRWGLRLRAAGDRPESLVAVGVSPRLARLSAALIGGALAGAGGAQLSLPIRGFSAGISGERGYMALAMVMLSGWRPGLAAIACIGVGVAEVFKVQLLTTHALAIPAELVSLTPYIATVVVLIVFDGKARKPPSALGKL